jgi:ABC-type branched-subunit amino acid transport system substrate-binding protein
MERLKFGFGASPPAVQVLTEFAPFVIQGGNKLRRFLVVAAVLGILATTAACGSTSSATVASTSTTAATGTSATSGSGGTPIIVGGDASLIVSQGIAQGFEAGIYRFNKAGGLDGRTIKFLGVSDDGFSPATALANAQRLVESNHAIVIAPFSSAGAGTATGTYLQANQTPFIGWDTSPAFTAAPTWGFGINGNQLNPTAQPILLNGILTVMHATKTPGNVKIAVIANDYPTATSGMQNASAVFQSFGMKVVYQKSPIPVIGTTNYQPYAQAVIASGANALYMVTSSPDAVGLSLALKSAGWKGAIFSPVTYFPGQLSSQPSEAAALNGTYVANEFPADENPTPAVAQAKKDLASVGQPPHLTSGASVGYWSAIYLEQLLKATLKNVGGDPNKVTGAAIAKTVNGGWTYTDPIAGGIGTAYFPAAEKIPTGCGTFLKVVGAGYQQITPYQCLGAINIKTNKVISQKTGVGS